ncbi:MAG: tetratricopeptide repeat protein, partial [Acidobacteriota bacterium]
EQAAKQTPEQIAEQAAKVAEYEKQKKSLEEKQSSVQASFTAGMEAYSAKKWDAAIESLTKASQIDPKQDVVWANLGDSYAQRGGTLKGAERVADNQKSVEAWAKAIELKPLNAGYHNNMALALAGSKKLDGAKEEFEQAAKLDPPQAGLYYRNLGSSYFDANQNEAAEAAYKKAIEAEPSNPDNYYRLGLSLIGRVTGAGPDGKLLAPAGTAEAFQKYLELAPTGANAEESKGMLEALGAKVVTGFKGNAPPPAAGKGKAAPKGK